ncbi:MAG TPA: hypothetical protein VF493_02200, partial [Terriglobales bacterium]
MQSSLTKRKPHLRAGPFIPALVSLLVAAYIAWAARPIPPRSFASYILLQLARGIGVVGVAAIYLGITVLVQATVLITWFAISRMRDVAAEADMRRILLQSSAAACCIAPLMLAGPGSVWVSAAFSILITLCLVEIVAHGRPDTSSPHQDNQSRAMFFLENLQPWRSRFSAALAGSAAAQLGLLAGALNLRSAAALLLSIGAALILWQLPLRSKLHFGSESPFLSIAATAVVITAAGLLQYFMVLRAGEPVPFATAL